MTGQVGPLRLLTGLRLRNMFVSFHRRLVTGRLAAHTCGKLNDGLAIGTDTNTNTTVSSEGQMQRGIGTMDRTLGRLR